MAYPCLIGIKKECDGCQECSAKPVMTDEYDAEIFAGDKYYEFDDGIVAESNIDEYLKEHAKVARHEDYRW